MSGTKIALIGDYDTTLGFRLVGINLSVIPKNVKETREALKQFFRNPDVGIILITEKIAETVSDLIAELSQSPTPSIVEIPDRSGSSGRQEKRLHDKVKRAIGVETNL